MLKLYNIEHKKIQGLINYKEAILERELKTGDEKLSFSYPIFDKFYKDIVEECYIRTKENEYIVKEIHELDNFTEFTCFLNVEDLEGKPWDRYESIEKNIVDALNLAIVSTGWRVGFCNVSKKRTVRKSNCSSWDIIQDIKKTYMVDLQFDCINKKINVYEHLGRDKGVYFMDSLNVIKLESQRDSHNFYTRLIPLGKDGLTINAINEGKDYVENYQYSKKIKTFYWKDDRYTVVENLKKDGQSKLNELSKPRRAYKVDINNLAKSSKGKYEILDYSLGDTITLISKSKRVKEKQRIVKIKEYLLDHSKDTVEIANTILSFEEMQQQLQDAAETVSNITTDNGTVDGSCVDNIEAKQINNFEVNVMKAVDFKAVNASIENLTAKKADIQDLNVVKERVGTLEATTITTNELKAVDVKVDNLEATKAKVTDLKVTNEKVKVIEADTGNIKTLLNGNLTSENIQSGGITSDKLTIFDAFIKNAMIDSIDINKMNAGTISTEKFNIVSNNGNLTIKDNTIQIKDSKNVRVQIGKDGSNNYGIYVWDVLGNLMFSSDKGLMEQGIKNKIIRDDMISDKANIQAYKLDINSVFREMNSNSNTLNATRIKIDSENQTLDMAFSKLKTTTENNKETVENALTKIQSQQGQIKATIESSKIIEDKQKTLEDNYNRTVATVDSINNKLGSHKSILDGNSNKISSVEAKTNTLERNLEGMKEKVSSYEYSINKDLEKVTENMKNNFSELQSTIDSINLAVDNTKKQIVTEGKEVTTKLDSARSDINSLKDKIKLSVSSEQLESTKSLLNHNIDKIKKDADEKINNLNLEVTKTNKKSASLETDINGITSKVSNMESNTEEINGKLNSYESRLTTAEQKITSKAIVNTVSSTIQEKINNLKIGGENLLKNADFSNYWVDNHIGWDDKINGSFKVSHWNLYNGGVENASKGSHAHLNIDKFNFPSIVFRSDDSNRWLGATQSIKRTLSSFKAGMEYTISMEIYMSNTSQAITGGLYYKAKDGKDGFHSGQFSFQVKEDKINQWVKFSHTFKISKDVKEDELAVSLFIYGHTKGRGWGFICKPKLEEGNVATSFTLNSKNIKDSLNKKIEETKAEQKIELDKITNSVNGCATKSEVIQSSQKWEAKFKDFNVINIVSNSRPTKTLNYWDTTYDSTANKSTITLATDGGENWQGEYFNSGFWFTTYKRKNSWCGIFNNSFQHYKFNTSSKYRLTFPIYCSQNKNCTITIRIARGDSQKIIFNKTITLKGSSYNLIDEIFIPQNVGEKPLFMIFSEDISDNTFYIPYVMLCEGEGNGKWCPNSNEIYDGITTIDGNGIRCDFNDGSYAIMGHDGFEHWRNGMSRPYHYLCVTGAFTSEKGYIRRL